MKIQFLGTAAAEAVPALFCPCEKCVRAREMGGRELRTRCGALIDDTIKLDFPPDTYHHIIANGLDFSGLQDIFITHSHSDHLAFLDLEMVSPPYAQKRKGFPITVYGDDAVEKLVSPFLSDDWLHFTRVRPFETVKTRGYSVSALKAVHAMDEEALFFLIEKDGASILYAHDTDEFTDADMEFLAGRKIDIISLDCTNGLLDADYIGHMGLHDNGRMREKLLANAAADLHTVFVSNHFSHNGVGTIAEMEQVNPGFVIAYDGMVLETKK